jgi:hypothetical protein
VSLVEHWRTWPGGNVELTGGPHDGQRVWMPPGPLRPWIEVLEPEPGALVPIRTWQARHRTTGGCLYRLTDAVSAVGQPIYALERRADPRRPR